MAGATKIDTWARVFKRAPDLVYLLEHHAWGFKIEADHALLLTLLHPADQKCLLAKKNHEAMLRECAWIVAHHDCGHDPYGRDACEQLYYLSVDLPDEDDRLYALEHYLESTCDESGKEIDRDLEQIITCSECIEYWRTYPQRRRAARLAAAAIYQPSPVKPRRRTKTEIENLKNIIYQVVRDNEPMTVRQVFYQMVAAGMIQKDEHEYKNTACSLLLQMRRAGELPYAWIADNTRWMRKTRSFNSLQEALADCAASYRRAVWHELSCPSTSSAGWKRMRLRA